MTGKLCARLRLDRPEAVQDNKTLYKLLEESLGGDAARSAILPRRVSKDGRASWLALVSSAGGQAKWEAVEDEKRIELTRRKWMENGQVTISDHSLYFSLTLEDHRLAAEICDRCLLKKHQEVTTFLKTRSKDSPVINAAICNC